MNKLPDNAKNSATDATKTASKRAIQKIAEGTGDNKVTEKLTGVASKGTHEALNKSTTSAKIYETSVPMEIPKERYHQKDGSKLLVNSGYYNYN